jgi:hypothetical protein
MSDFDPDGDFERIEVSLEEPPKTDLPRIEIVTGKIKEAADEAEKALIAAHPWSPVERVFRRGDRMVSLAVDKTKDQADRDPNHRRAGRLRYRRAPRGGGDLHEIRRSPERRGRIEADRPANGARQDAEGARLQSQASSSGRRGELPAARRRWANSGQAGLRRADRDLFDPRGAKFPVIAACPTPADAMGKKDRVLRLLHTFDFQTEKDRSVALSLSLTRLGEGRDGDRASA